MSLTRITAPDGVQPSDGYTHVITGPGRLVVLAGQMPFDADGRLVGVGDPAEQARQVFRNLRNCLASAGATFADLVKVNCYLTDIQHLPAVLAARDEFIDTARPPASTVVAVSALFDPEMVLEVDGLAIVANSM